MWLFAIGVVEMAGASTISIDPIRTFLRTSNDGAGPNIPIDLVSLGLSAGDIVRLEQLGDFARWGASGLDDATEMIGVFSASATLLGSATLNRVQDALDAGIDMVTRPTFFGGFATDISEDFLITDIVIDIPLGASHLFIAARDSFYGDNTDPDGDYAVRINAVPIPGTVWLFSSGLAGLAATRLRRKTQKRPALNR